MRYIRSISQKCECNTQSGKQYYKKQVKCLFFIVKKIFVNDNKYKNIPIHLLQLAKFLNIYENESKEFNKKFGNKVIYVDNSKELLSYLLKESL